MEMTIDGRAGEGSGRRPSFVAALFQSYFDRLPNIATLARAADLLAVRLVRVGPRDALELRKATRARYSRRALGRDCLRRKLTALIVGITRSAKTLASVLLASAMNRLPVSNMRSKSMGPAPVIVPRNGLFALTA